MATSTFFYLGDRVRLSATFAGVSGALFDPTGITLAIGQQGSAPAQSQTYPGGGIVRDGVGLYHYDWLANILGPVAADWLSTQPGLEGNGVAVVTIRPANGP